LVQGIPGLCFQGSSRELPSHSQELFLSHLLCCSPRMRIALLVQDDSAVDCLGPLVAKSCTVLGISSSGLPCAIFARRCAELGFDFTLSSDPAVAGVAVRSFKPEMVVSVSHGCQLSSVFADQAGFDSVKKFDLHIGSVTSEGAPWPEFPPIWLGHASSLVSLTALNEEKCLKGALSVAVTKDDTALSLRAKHAAAAAELLRMLLEGTDMPAASPPEAEVAVPVKAPDTISLKWDDGTADRYIRARYLPPHDPAVVKDPATGEGYFINDMHQYRTFCSKVLDSGSAQAEGKAKAYAADTHWYAYVCGNFVKVGDSDIHVPIRTSDRKRQAVIPGAAISGRKKLRMNEPLIGPNAEHYCASALASSWIGVEGPYVKQLERHLARITGCSAACAVQSGTAALYGAMKALGVSEAAHHVLVPSFTCAACADAVVHAGGLPVPVDSELDSYGISLEAVRRAVEVDKDVVGIVVAPCYGVPAKDFFALLRFCKDHGLWICEDACESYGAMQATRSVGGDAKVPVGSLATLTEVSIRSEKMIGVGEGGAILGNDTVLVGRAKWWCSRAPSRGVGLWRVYEHDAVGQNFRLPEMLAAVGCAAAEMLPVMIERKRAIHSWYKHYFAAMPALSSVKLQLSAEDDEPVWWINSALMPEDISGEEVGTLLMKEYPDIEIRPGFYPLHMMAIFSSSWTQGCPNAELLYKRLVCLPSSSLLAEPDVERICGALAEALQKVTIGNAQ